MLVTTVWRLAGELRKTQRRVNALQYIFIPDYEETVAFIVSSLEEREREEIFRLKLLKNRAAKAQSKEKGPVRPIASALSALGKSKTQFYLSVGVQGMDIGDFDRYTGHLNPRIQEAKRQGGHLSV